jgi:hypothetical protein
MSATPSGASASLCNADSVKIQTLNSYPPRGSPAPDRTCRDGRTTTVFVEADRSGSDSAFYFKMSHDRYSAWLGAPYVSVRCAFSPIPRHRLDWPDQPRNVPPGPFDNLTHLARRDDQVIKPRCPSLPETNTKAKLPCKSSSTAIQFVVTAMIGGYRLVRISGFRDDPGCR